MSADTRVLVLDDHEDTLLTLKDVLELGGMVVMTALSVGAADQILEAGFLPTLLLVDLNLAGRTLTGRDYIGKLRADPRFSGAAIVAMSGAVPEARKLLETGLVDDLLEKPFTPERLGWVVEHAPLRARLARAYRRG